MHGEREWGCKLVFSDEDHGYSRFYDSIDTVIMGRMIFEIRRGSI